MPDEITLVDLLQQMEARMGAKNPTKRLLWIAAQVLIQQAKEIAALREKEAQRCRAVAERRAQVVNSPDSDMRVAER